MSRHTILAVLVSFVATAPLAAQEAPVQRTAAPPTFKTGVDLVALSVTVVDQQQKYVSGLSSGDFQVFEDGVLQNLSFFSASQTPLDLAILLDTSASMGDKIGLAQTAACGLARSLRPADRAAVIDLKDRVNILQPFTGDAARLEAAIRSTRASGGTALYNAIYVALKQFAALPRSQSDVRRQAIVVLSDGDDTVSLMTFDDVLDVARRSGVAIYTIALRSDLAVLRSQGHGHFSQSDYSMKALAQETGGRSFFPTAASELSGIYSIIGEELATQYALAYAPFNGRPDGAFRRVVVRVVNRPDAILRTRSGYFGAQTPRALSAPGGSQR